MSLTIYIAVGFYILVLILDKLFLGIDLDLSTVFYVSVLLADLDLSIDLTLSVLLLLVVSTVILNAFDFSVLLTLSIFFFYEIGEVMASFTILGFVSPFFNRVSITFFDNRVSSSDQCLFGIIQIPTCFSNPFTWIIRLLRKWANGIV